MLDGLYPREDERAFRVAGKRIVIALYDAMTVGVIAFLASFALVEPAFAYIDPSVMTYTIQAVAGVAVALSTVAGVALRRGRKSVLRLLDIDENARREVEPDLHRVGENLEQLAMTAELEPEAAVLAELAEAVEPIEVVEPVEAIEPIETIESVKIVELTEGIEPEEESELVEPIEVVGPVEPESGEAAAPGAVKPVSRPSHKLKHVDQRPYSPSWKERFVYALIASAFTLYTVFVVAPLEIVGNAVGSLVFTLADVWWVPLGPVTAAVLVLALLMSAVRGKAFNVVLVVVAALGLCCYLQALVLNVGLPLADGGTIVWADHMFMQVVSTIVWVAVMALAIILALRNRKRAQGVIAIGGVFLLVVQFIGVASLFIMPPAPSEGQGGLDDIAGDLVQKTEIVMTEDQLFTVNSNSNVIVFVLDTYDYAYLRRDLGMNPSLLSELTGFTNYANCTGSMIPTRFAIPQMLTGEMPHYDEKFSTYKAQRYARSTFLQDIQDAGYSIGLYTDSLTIGALSDEEQYEITSKTVNMHSLDNDTMSYTGVLEAMWYMALYRDILWPLKWVFWYYTDEINAMMVVYDADAAPEQTVYVIDDGRYYNRLCSIGLSLEEGDYNGAFRFIHLLGAHYPFSYDEHMNYLGTDQSNVFKQSQGIIWVMNEYIHQLKELGVYEQSTIIITADHGYWTLTTDPIEETSTPIMFIKPAQSAELDAKPIMLSEKPVSQLDIQATVLDAMGQDYSKYTEKDAFEGYSILRDIDPERVRYYVTTDSEGLQEVAFREYVIDGDALNFDNWSETGRTWDAFE